MAGPNRRCNPRANAEHHQNADPDDGPDDGRLGGADQITERGSWIPVDDVVEAQVPAELWPGRQLAKRRRFPGGGAQSHAVLDAVGGAVAESLDRWDGGLGEGRQRDRTARPRVIL